MFGALVRGGCGDYVLLSGKLLVDPVVAVTEPEASPTWCVLHSFAFVTLVHRWPRYE